MKKIISFLFILLCLFSQAQVTPSKCVRIANSTTAFGENITRGTIITDATTGKVYSAFLGLASTKTIATCTMGSELIELTGSLSGSIGNANIQLVGVSDITGSTTEQPLYPYTNLTPTGSHLLIMFSAPFTVSGQNAQDVTVWLWINQVKIRKFKMNIYSNTQCMSFQHMQAVTPGVQVRVDVTWVINGTSLMQYGASMSERTLSIMDLP